MMKVSVWGECLHCGQRGHKSSHCRYKQNKDQKQSIPQTGRADKAAPKGKKKKNRRTGKRVAVNDNESRRERVRKKMKRFQKRNLPKSQHTEQKLSDLLD